MKIERRDAWTFDGRTFFDPDKVRDYVESLIFARVKGALLQEGFSERECFRVASYVIRDRLYLAEILSTEVEES